MAKEKKQKPQIVSFDAIIANPSDKSKLQGFIKTGVDSMIRAAAEKDHIKSIRDTAKEEIGLDPKMFNFLVKEDFNNAFSATKADLAEKEFALEALYGEEE